VNQYRTILTLAWPLIIANSFWNLQLTIDRVFLGMYSTEALGAAMAVMGVFWVPMALLQQTAGYVTAFVAQYFGANERDKISLSVWQSIHISWIGGILFVGLNFLSEPFFRMVGHGTTVQALEVEYFNSLAYTALPTAVVAAVSGYFTGVGRSQTVMSINFVGLILNVILDYVMIFGKFGLTELRLTDFGSSSMAKVDFLRPNARTGKSIDRCSHNF
jgi:MATE family multidrug resistance protein